MMKQAKKLYLKLFFYWATWVSLSSVIVASILCIFAALLTYALKGFAPLEYKTFLALQEIFYFSFPIAFSLSYICMLLLVFKAVFSWKIKGYKIRLYDCQDEWIEKPLISDIMMIWRRWLFLTVWSLLIFFLLFVGGWKVLSAEAFPMSWFNGVNIYLIILFFGGNIFSLGLMKCKKVRITNV